MIQQEIRYWLALAHAGNAIAQIALNDYLIKDVPIAQLFQEPTAITHPGLAAYLKTPAWNDVEKDLKWLEDEKEARIISWHDPYYPPLLKEIANPPLILYAQGKPEVMLTPQIAMVGSRNPSHAGNETAYHFAYHLAAAGLTITSGLALGIDVASHKGALAQGGKTIAVTGCGLDKLYPAQHARVAEQIKAHGLLLSIFPPGTAPKAHHFPIRNRIISGLCLGTLVVEAALKSGSLITARYAAEQGREVFAIPGSIQNPLSKGCHYLIRQGACLVEEIQDIVSELAQFTQHTIPSARLQSNLSANKGGLTPLADRLLSCFDHETTAVDSLIARSGLTAEQVCSMLSYLELQGSVIAVPGGYIKKG